MTYRPDNRKRLQLWMLSLIFFSIAVSFAITIYRLNEFSQLFVSNPNRLKEILGVTDIAVSWQGAALQRMIENTFSVYGAILVIMLTNFFTATPELLDQPVQFAQAAVAVVLFAIVQFVNISVFYFIFGPGMPITSSITAFQSAVLNTLVGIVVGFSFPDKPAERSGR